MTRNRNTIHVSVIITYRGNSVLLIFISETFIDIDQVIGKVLP